MLNLRLVALLSALSACVSGPSAQDKMASWNGERADRLVAVWGAPLEMVDVGQGQKMYVYEVAKPHTYVLKQHAQSGVQRFERDDFSSRVSFTISAQQKITGYETRGTNANSEQILGNPNSSLAH